jgi:putative transcriptional regulator
MYVIKMNVQKLLDEKKKTRYWLVKHMESNYETVNRLCDNQTVALRLETIEKLCRILECEPNDLFIIE